MLYLGLAILSSTLVSTVMRYAEGKIQNNMGMFMVNYAVCAACSGIFMGNSAPISAQPDMGFAIWLGLLSGILYLASFLLLQQNIRKNGVVLSATFMKLGVLIPTLMAILVFRERPKLLQILGIGLAIAAILVIHLDKEEKAAASHKLLLLVLLVGGGLTDSMANIYDQMGVGSLKDHYLLFTFMAAGVCAGVLWLKTRQRLCGADVLFGICIGVPNYFSSRFLLLALHRLSAVVVYPVYSVATIAVISLAGVLLFREKLNRRKTGAIGMIAAALVLLNL